jgi:uroporphyrinogen-III synthase
MSGRNHGGVLITRPEPAAHQTAEIVGRMGFTPVMAPMLVVSAHLLPRPRRPLQAILVTSANALPALDAFDRGTMLLTVGDATADRARRAGFTGVHSAGRDAEALVDLAISLCDPGRGPLFLASGAGQGLALARALEQAGFDLHRRVAYGARAVRALPTAAIDALDGTTLRHALFFSSATARAFVACVLTRAGQLGGIEALAISTSTAAALAPLPWLRIRVASHPNQDELVALLT